MSRYPQNLSLLWIGVNIACLLELMNKLAFTILETFEFKNHAYHTSLYME